MSPSLARTALCLLAAILPCLAASAGEFARPVPSNAQVTRFTRFNLRYTLRDVVADGVQKVDFYITDDMGATWRYYGEDPDRISPMTVEVPGEGVYGFVCVATDQHGNREREPLPRTRPETVIVVDRTPPDARWLGPKQDILGRGQNVELSWESSDEHFGDTPVKLQYAINATSNHDRNAAWQDLATNRPANGSYTWTPPASERYNFRLVAEDRAGNMAVAYCPATVAIDNTPPYVTAVRPLRSNKLENSIIVEASDGDNGSGVKEYSIYISDNGSATWTLVKEPGPGGDSVPVKRRSGEGIVWRAPRSGEYPVWPVVFDEAGNATPLPQIGVAGPFILVLDNEPPQVTLSNSFLQGRNTVLSNDSRRLEWTAYDVHIQEGSTRIYLSLDNGDNWQELRSGLAVNGFETISFPFGSESEEARIKVTVADTFDNVGEAVSEPFKLTRAETTIDSVTPRGGATGSLDDYTATPAPAVDPVTPTLPASPAAGDPWFGFGGGSSATPAPTAPAPAPAVNPYDILGPGAPGGSTDIYGGGTDMYQRPVGSLNYSTESTAGSLPRAMLQDGQAAAPSAPAPGLPVPPPAATAPDWNPTPGAAVAMGDWQASSPAAPAPDWQTSPAVVPAPPAATGDIAAAPPAWPGSPPAEQPPVTAPATPAPAMPLGGDDWASGGIAPPPMPSAPGGESAFPEMPSLGDATLSLDTLGGGLSLPSMPGDAQAAAPAPTPAPSQPWPATTTQMPPVAEAGPPPAVPQVGESASSDIFTPPPLQTAPSRPANPRALAEHYIKESKAYRDQGRPDLALDAATRAVESDASFAEAYVELSQVNARKDPPDYVRAANLAKEATGLKNDWETWWNCADVFYIWAHASNREIQSMIRSGQTPPVNLVDERNSTLSNAGIAVNNAASILPPGDRDASKKVMVTQGMIAYLRALTVPEPTNPGVTEGPAFDEYRRQQATYKSSVAPLLQEAMPYFQNAVSMGGQPEYNELFQMGIINFRLAGLERDTGNPGAALRHYTDAARYLVEATQAASTPKEGPREAYYMLALSHDQLANQPDGDRARNRELALRYWRQTADFYEPGTPYRVYAEQRIDAITGEMGY